MAIFVFSLWKVSLLLIKLLLLLHQIPSSFILTKTWSQLRLFLQRALNETVLSVIVFAMGAFRDGKLLGCCCWDMQIFQTRGAAKHSKQTVLNIVKVLKKKD